MSRSTPRKNRQHHNRHQSGPRIMPASDYESDAAYYMENRPAPAPPQLLHRTNTDLNLSVLQRYLPSINAIRSIAANAVVYTFAPQTHEWDKAGIEGTLFVCSQDAAALAPTIPRACVFVLNRRGLNNLILDLAKVSDFEVTDQLLIFRLEPSDGEDEDGADGDESSPKIVGLWIHADEDHTRTLNGALIYEAWKSVREAAQATSAAGLRAAREESVGPAMQAMGRKLSVSDLFGRQNGAGL